MKYSLLYLLLPLLIQQNNVFSQSVGQDSKNSVRLSFGQHILPEQLGLHAKDKFEWKILNAKNELVADQSKGDLFSQEFSLPGNYVLHVDNTKSPQDHQCSHHSFSGSWLVEVSPVQVRFDLEKLSFSNELLSENIQRTLEMYIPVTVLKHNPEVSDIEISKMRVAFQGVDCNVIVKPKNPELKLSNGDYQITYTLTGSVPKKTYIMIDFIDQNGNITTYYHPNEL